MRKDERAVAARVAAEVRRLRTALGWSQLALAERAGISLNYVNLIERAEQLPTIRVLLRLAAALGTTLGPLVDAGATPPESAEAGDPWEAEAGALLRAVPAEARPVALGVLRAVVEATAPAPETKRPAGKAQRQRRRKSAPPD